MQLLAIVTATCALHAAVFASAQEPRQKERTRDVLAGTWLPQPERYEEYWAPKDTNGLQRMPVQPSRTSPVLTITVLGERITAQTVLDGALISSHVYTGDDNWDVVPLADGVVESTDAHWTPGGLVLHHVTERHRDLLIRGGEFWELSDDARQLTITTTKEGMGSKSKTVTVYRRQ